MRVMKMRELEVLCEKVELEDKLEKIIITASHCPTVEDRAIELLTVLKTSDNNTVEKQEQLMTEAEQFINTVEF